MPKPITSTRARTRSQPSCLNITLSHAHIRAHASAHHICTRTNAPTPIIPDHHTSTRARARSKPSCLSTSPSHAHVRAHSTRPQHRHQRHPRLLPYAHTAVSDGVMNHSDPVVERSIRPRTNCTSHSSTSHCAFAQSTSHCAFAHGHAQATAPICTNAYAQSPKTLSTANTPLHSHTTTHNAHLHAYTCPQHQHEVPTSLHSHTAFHVHVRTYPQHPHEATSIHHNPMVAPQTSSAHKKLKLDTPRVSDHRSCSHITGTPGQQHESCTHVRITSLPDESKSRLSDLLRSTGGCHHVHELAHITCQHVHRDGPSANQHDMKPTDRMLVKPAGYRVSRAFDGETCGLQGHTFIVS